MRSWLNPLPAETVIGAIIGAVLGSVLERNEFLDIPDWVHSLVVFQLIFLILAFGVCAHFYCAASYLQKGAIKGLALFGCVLVIGAVLFMYPKRLTLDADTSIVFLPHEYNALMSGVLVLWLITLRVLTLLKTLLRE